MIIGGFQKFSLSDFPGTLAAIVFSRGCGFRCPYCHNPELVDPSRYAAALDVTEIREFLVSRKGRIQGVVVTGGEPTFHADLPEFLSDLKKMNLRVKLDTNGTNPRMLKGLIEERLIDFIAMDIKAPLRLYESVVRAPVATADLLNSIELILKSGLPHEFRTTCLDGLLSIDDICEAANLVKGCQKYILQAFRGEKVLEAGLERGPASTPQGQINLATIARTLKSAGHVVEIR